MKNGFTLIELLVYLGLFSLILGGAVVAVYQMLESAQVTRSNLILQSEGSFLLGKMEWMLDGTLEVVEGKENSFVIQVVKNVLGAPLVLTLHTHETDAECPSESLCLKRGEEVSRFQENIQTLTSSNVSLVMVQCEFSGDGESSASSVTISFQLSPRGRIYQSPTQFSMVKQLSWKD